MSTEAALIAAMAASPDDDTVRLAFADWLDERGTPADQVRAEFIRLQCRPDSGTDPGEARAKELESAHQAAWDAPLAPIGGEVVYRRGFPHYLKADFVRVVEHRTLLGLAPDWHLCPTREDEDFDEADTDRCAALVAGPFADRIRGLSLAWAGWHFDEIEALLRPPLVGRLRELRFEDRDDAPAVLELLARAPDLRLDVLGFVGDSYGGVGDSGCRFLAGAERFGSLTALELPNNDLTAAGVEALAGSPHLVRLRALDLQGGSNSTNTVGDAGVRHLAGSATFKQLTDLNLTCNGVTDEGVRALLASPHLGALARLNLPMNALTDAALVALAESDGLPALNWLNVSAGLRSRAIAGAIGRLVQSPRMEKLIGLKLGGHPIGPAGALALADSPNCRNLRELHIGGCGVGAEAFVRLLESPHLAGVRAFAVYNKRTPKLPISGAGTAPGWLLSEPRRSHRSS